jgi:hypothetical protein
MSAGQYLFNQ